MQALPKQQVFPIASNCFITPETSVLHTLVLVLEYPLSPSPAPPPQPLPLPLPLSPSTDSAYVFVHSCVDISCMKLTLPWQLDGTWFCDAMYTPTQEILCNCMYFGSVSFPLQTVVKSAPVEVQGYAAMSFATILNSDAIQPHTFTSAFLPTLLAQLKSKTPGTHVRGWVDSLATCANTYVRTSTKPMGHFGLSTYQNLV